MSSKLLSHRAALCNIVRRVAEEAGEIILEYFVGDADMKTAIKDDGSPVTLADHEAEKHIETKLKAMLPDIPFIGEEAIAEKRGEEIAGHDYFWLCDPLDGTKEFLRGGEDFTVNIALIHKGEPVLGVIYAPARGELYAGYRDEETGGGRAFRYFEDSKTEKDIRVRRAPKEGMIVLASSSHGNVPDMARFLEGFKVSKIIRRSSSLKLCAIASGKADIYVRFGPTCEWDTAAGDAILRVAGGGVKNMDGTLLTYGCGDPDFFNPHFVAASSDVF